MAYFYLMIAILCEVTATSALKMTEEFTRILPSIIVVIGYALSFYFLTLTLRSFPLGITYAIWSGIGIVLITLVGVVAFKQVPDLAAILGMLLIVAGVATIHLFSDTINP